MLFAVSIQSQELQVGVMYKVLYEETRAKRCW